MTTDTGSVWDRGPGGDDDAPSDPSHTEISPAETEPVDTELAESEPADVADEPLPAPPETVWSRGPAPEVIATQQPTTPVRNPPEPVLPPPHLPVPKVRPMPQVRRPAKVLAGALVVVLFGALAWSLGVVGGDDPVPALASDTSVALLPVVSLPSTTAAPATTPPTTSSPATTVAPSTSTSTSTTSTTTSTTSTTSSTSTSTTTSTTVASTTVPAVIEPTGPQVAIVGRVGPCKFGDDCLLADFTISDFTSPQSEFVCDFGNGSRYTFRFDGHGADQACSTSAADGSITIEVGGVRSETITR